ncbi:MAG: hypothetical protein OSB36_05705, partial [Longimicrobiales bacterium]|nr:hypothetical protein [Longimicrobiales bacterium]
RLTNAEIPCESLSIEYISAARTLLKNIRRHISLLLRLKRLLVLPEPSHQNCLLVYVSRLGK